MNELSVMTPEHPRWEEFLNRLEGPEGCNFREDPVKGYIWDCKAGDDKPFATKILESMGGVDIQRSLSYFNNHRCHCDCEIIFNLRQ